MSKDFALSAEVRSDYGKGASRRLRRTNKFPGIIYGGGGNPTPVSLDHNEMTNNLQNEAFFSHILTLKVDGAEEQAIIIQAENFAYGFSARSHERGNQCACTAALPQRRDMPGC